MKDEIMGNWKQLRDFWFATYLYPSEIVGEEMRRVGK